jgi:hypothetical protein
MIENYQIPKYGHQNLLTYDEYKRFLGEAQTGDSEAIIRLFTFYEFGVYEKSKSNLWKMRGLELHIAYFLYQFGNDKSQISSETGYKYIQCAADSGYTGIMRAMSTSIMLDIAPKMMDCNFLEERLCGECRETKTSFK